MAPPASQEKEKKRKRQGADVEKPAKKRSVEVLNGEIKVTHATPKDRLCPVIASVPGIHLKPTDFTPYVESHGSDNLNATPAPSSHSILLHSSAHPQLDYTASSLDEKGLSHYLGVFDPEKRTLQLVPAHPTTVRTTLRSEVVEFRADEAISRAKQRELLGMEFGTKKAKKALTSKVINAIGAEAGKGVESAVMATVNSTSSALPTRSERDDAVLDAKPIPKPNLETDEIELIYSIDQLIPKGDMRDMAVKDWQDKVKNDIAIDFTSRFVANRVVNIVKSQDIKKLRALKYLLLLLDFVSALRPARGGRTVPQRDELKQKMEAWPETAVDNVRRRFAEGGDINKWHFDNLMTHMAAISLYIDGYRTDTHDLREDLRMENRQMSQYFHELGCRIRSPTDKEYSEFKITKVQAATRKVAVLRLPLDFPKTRMPPKRR